MTDETEKILNKWFEMKYKTYNKLEHGGSIYLYYEGQEYAEIRILKKREYIYYHWKLYEEFFQIIPIEVDDFEQFMVKWVEDTFNLKEFTPDRVFHPARYALKIPLI